MKKIIPHNTDKDGCATTIKANYYKMGGGANFLEHSNDGFKATCIIEIYEEDSNPSSNEEGIYRGDMGGGYMMQVTRHPKHAEAGCKKVATSAQPSPATAKD